MIFTMLQSQYENNVLSMQNKSLFKDMCMFCLNATTLLVASLPVLVLKDELPQLEVSEDQAVVVAVRHR